MSSYEQSAEINELAMALAKAQSAMRAASKDSVNPHFKSRYADLASVWDACREPLSANGLSVVQMPMAHQDGYTALRTVLLHASGQYMATTISARLTKDDAQGIGSALTYLRRYSLAAMVGIVADEDDDGSAASGRHQQQAQPARQTTPQARPVVVSEAGVIEQPKPAANEPFTGKLSGPVSQVQTAYNAKGDLTVRFRCAGRLCMALKAPAETIHLQDGDPVVVKGELRTYKGEEFVNVESMYHADNPRTWEDRARAQADQGAGFDPDRDAEYDELDKAVSGTGPAL